jgi:1,4-dihydroxy-2-naphthoate octaprenyltransferase
VVASGDARFTAEAAWGLAGAGLLVGALYPLTQLFQIEEDAARGDVTAAMALGRRGTCVASIALAALGGASMSLSARAGGHAVDAVLLGVAALPMMLGTVWVCQPIPSRTVFRRVTLLQIGAGAGFGLYTLSRIVGVLD